MFLIFLGLFKALQGSAQLNVDFSANNTSVCSGLSVIFTNNSTGAAGSATYNWSFGTGASPSSATGSGPITVKYTGSGTSTVSLTVTDIVTQTKTKTNYITVYPLPVATISGTTTVCQNGASPNITFTGASGTAPYTFTYNVNGATDKSVTTLEGNSLTVAVPTASSGTLTYVLKSVRDASAGACSQLQSGSAVVTISEMPLVNAGKGGDICGSTFTLNAVPSIGTGKWAMVSGIDTVTFSPNASTPNATVTIKAYGTYIFAWTETNGACSGTKEVTVNFYKKPVANPGTGGNSCGLNFMLSAVPTPEAGTGTWTKTTGPGNVTFTPDANSPGAEVTASAYGLYTFTWTETNAICVSSATVNVNFILTPAANAGPGGSVCGYIFGLNAVPGTGGTWKKISGPGNVVFTPDTHQPGAKANADTPGTYQFAWTVVNITCQSSSLVNVTFYGSPNVSASGDTAVCKGKSVTIHAQGTGIFHWSPENSVLNYNIPDPIVSPLVPTYYKVTVTDQRGCTSTDSTFVDVWTVPAADAGKDLILEYLFSTPVTAAEPELHSRGVWSVIFGTGTFDDTTSAATVVSGFSTGKNVLLWTVSNGICQSSNALLTIIVHDLVIPTLITPNMDGRNDNFILRGIETLGKTELVIFNRWGGKVYMNANYNNEWNGVDSNGDPLPDDTYFFTLKAENGISKSGFIVIRR